ncbi:MAG: anion permease, partial [Deltaproteobacteria bacterium]|nr:anion permease [Deltaproteobacteria bacterium]
ALLALRVLGGNYWRMLLGLAFAGYALAFLIPSAMVRVVLLAPLAVELARVLKQEKGSAGAAGIFLALGASTYYSGYSVLTGGLPNIILLGILEKEGMTIFWGQWGARMIPVFGLGAVFAVYASLRLWFRAPQLPGDLRALTRELELLGPPSAAERRVIWLLGLAIALWATDFLHHIHPTFVALLVSSLLFVPYVGVLDFEAVRGLNFSIVLFYIGAVFAIGTVLQGTGFTAWASGQVLEGSGLERLGWFGRHYVVTLIASLFALFMDTLAESSVITPIFIQYAKAHGMDVINTTFSLAIGYAFPYFPYQAAPIIFLLGYGYVTPQQVLRATLFVGGAGILVLAPIAMVYWRLLGLI